MLNYDAACYYGYLPATFVENDPTLRFYNPNDPLITEKYLFVPVAKTGGYFHKTTMGVALMEAPFFLITHWTTSKSQQNGFSTPYKCGIALSALLWCGIGLWFLRRVLLRYCTEGVVAATLLAIGFGTNLMFYTVFEGGMSHAYSFGLISMFLWFTIQWYENPRWKYAVYLGLLMGIISLIRPTNALIAVVLLLWNVQSFAALWERVQWYLLRKPLYVLLMVACCLLVWLPQMLYWHALTGDWLFYSYENVTSVGRFTEKFFWSDPQWVNVLFSYRKGWFVYTPLMLFAVIGIAQLYTHAKESFWSILVFFVLNIYVISCWWSWWYGGGLGMRPLIDTYAFMAIPLALMLQRFLKHTSQAVVSLTTQVLVLCIAFNLLKVYQAHYAIIHWDGMNRTLYWNTFLKMQGDDSRDKLATPPNAIKALQGYRSEKDLLSY